MGPNLARLPVMDGFEVCERIKANKDLGTKVMVITGKIDAIDAPRAREAGADDYIVKTSDLSIMINEIRKLLKEE